MYMTNILASYKVMLCRYWCGVMVAWWNCYANVQLMGNYATYNKGVGSNI